MSSIVFLEVLCHTELSRLLLLLSLYLVGSFYILFSVFFNGISGWKHVYLCLHVFIVLFFIWQFFFCLLVLSYSGLFTFSYIYHNHHLDASFFLMREIPNDVYFTVWVDGEDLAEFGAGGAIIWIYCVKKNCVEFRKSQKRWRMWYFGNNSYILFFFSE